MKKYDIAAYIWPSYNYNEKLAKIFWPKGIGEWETVQNTTPQYKGHKWPRIPLWGYQNEANPKVMEKQINEAIKYGVNVFIYDWYYYDNKFFLDQCLNEGFLKAKNNSKMKFYIMWANHDASTMWDKRNADEQIKIWNGFQNFETFKKLVNYWIVNYFKKKNYYRIDDKPVFMIYDIDNFIKGFDNDLSKAKKAINYFRKEVKKFGFKDVHIQAVIQNVYTPKINNEKYEKLGFDSITLYQMCNLLLFKKKFPDFYEYKNLLNDLYEYQNNISNDYKIPYFPHVSVGWDNNQRFNNFMKGVVKNNTPELFKKGLEITKEYLDKNNDLPKLITINSWNEWTEDSYLEPDNINGYKYLEKIKEVFKK